MAGLKTRAFRRPEHLQTNTNCTPYNDWVSEVSSVLVIIVIIIVSLWGTKDNHMRKSYECVMHNARLSLFAISSTVSNMDQYCNRC